MPWGETSSEMKRSPGFESAVLYKKASSKPEPLLLLAVGKAFETVLDVIQFADRKLFTAAETS